MEPEIKDKVENVWKDFLSEEMFINELTTLENDVSVFEGNLFRF